MSHIASHGGRFVTVVPHGRREDTWFRDWAQTHAPDWAEAHRRPGARLGDPNRIWRTFEPPAPSVDGHQVIWVHSSTKAARDAATRAARIEAGLAATDAVATGLSSPKTRLKTKVAAETAANTALTAAGATRWVGFTPPKPQTSPTGRNGEAAPVSSPLPAQRETHLHDHRRDRAENVAYDAATDGTFPLITNDTAMTPAEVLAAYRYQPTSNAATTCSKDPRKSRPSTCRQHTASKRCCSATSSPCSPRRSSNARSGP